MTPRSRRSSAKASKKDKRRAGGAPPAAGAVRRPPPAHGRSTSARRPTAGRWNWLTTWWGRLVAVAVGVGAIAGAIAGVVGLWPKPDPVDRATITSLQVTGPEQLSSFDPVVSLAAGGSGTAAPRLPAPFATEPGAPEDTGHVEPAGFTEPTTSTARVTTPPEQSTTASSTSASETTGTTGTSSSSTTGSSTSSAPTTSATPTTGSPSTSISAPPTGVAPIVGLSDRLRGQLYEDIRVQEVLRGFALPQELPPPAPPPLDAPTKRSGGITILTVDAVDENGDPVPPQEAAKRLATRLATVRSTPTPEGEDPLGMRVTVNLEIEGLRNETLVLYWRLVQAGSTPVPDTWQEWVPAAELTAGTERDTGFATMWVPLPEDPGPYLAEVVVMQESGNAPLTSTLTEPFG